MTDAELQVSRIMQDCQDTFGYVIVSHSNLKIGEIGNVIEDHFVSPNETTVCNLSYKVIGKASSQELLQMIEYVNIKYGMKYRNLNSTYKKYKVRAE